MQNLKIYLEALGKKKYEWDLQSNSLSAIQKY